MVVERAELKIIEQTMNDTQDPGVDAVNREQLEKLLVSPFMSSQLMPITTSAPAFAPSKTLTNLTKLIDQSEGPVELWSSIAPNQNELLVRTNIVDLSSLTQKERDQAKDSLSQIDRLHLRGFVGIISAHIRERDKRKNTIELSKDPKEILEPQLSDQKPLNLFEQVLGKHRAVSLLVKYVIDRYTEECEKAERRLDFNPVHIILIDTNTRLRGTLEPDGQTIWTGANFTNNVRNLLLKHFTLDPIQEKEKRAKPGRRPGVKKPKKPVKKETVKATSLQITKPKQTDEEQTGEIKLTDRELEVLIEKAKDKTAKKIATALDISAATVKTHTSNIFGKLDVRDILKTVTKALDMNLLSPEQCLTKKFDIEELNQLSPAELAVFECIAQGQSNKEIAESLKITYQTVRNHKNSMFRKLGLNSRIQVGIVGFVYFKSQKTSS